jgi:exosome complex component RRP45
VDARDRLSTRHIDVRYGTANGQVLLKLGKTHIQANSSLKLTQPREGKPNEGTYKFNVEFSSLLHGCDNAGMNITIQEMRVDIALFIDKVLKSSRAIDRESLCIIQGRLVWNLTVDLYVLNEDGNLFDACFLAAVACLMNTRLPEVTLTGPHKVNVNETKVRNLNVHHIPVCTSFYFIEGISSLKPIVDATSKEEKLAQSRLSICMNIFEDLCGMTTLGSLEVDPRILRECTKTALTIAKEITRKVRDAFSKKLSI